jgi:hypothetical protein
MMKKHCVRVLGVFFGLAALGASALGQVSDQMTVNIPYEFVVAGKTLPAGSYRINRVNDRDDRVLVISSFANHAAVVVSPSEVADRTGAEQPRLSFRQVGDQHLLSKIETAEHVFTIPVSSTDALETAMKKPSGPSGSASSGNN